MTRDDPGRDKDRIKLSALRLAILVALAEHGGEVRMLYSANDVWRLDREGEQAKWWVFDTLQSAGLINIRSGRLSAQFASITSAGVERVREETGREFPDVPNPDRDDRHAPGIRLRVTADTVNRAGHQISGREEVRAGWTGIVVGYPVRAPDPEHGAYVHLRLDSRVGHGPGGYPVVIPQGVCEPAERPAPKWENSD